MATSDMWGIEPQDSSGGGGGGGPPTGPAGGDLYGTYPNPNVGGLVNRPLDKVTAPAVNDTIIWSGSQWTYGPQSTPIRTGLSYVSPPGGRNGLLYSLVGNATVDTAWAQSVIRSRELLGVYVASRNGVQPIRGLPIAPVRLVPGLVGLVGGMELFVSSVVGMEGLATPNPPTTTGHLIVRIGILDDPTGYVAGDPTGSPVLCCFDPYPISVVP